MKPSKCGQSLTMCPTVRFPSASASGLLSALDPVKVVAESDLARSHLDKDTAQSLQEIFVISLDFLSSGSGRNNSVFLSKDPDMLRRLSAILIHICSLLERVLLGKFFTGFCLLAQLLSFICLALPLFVSLNSPAVLDFTRFRQFDVKKDIIYFTTGNDKAYNAVEDPAPRYQHLRLRNMKFMGRGCECQTINRSIPCSLLPDEQAQTLAGTGE